MTIENAKELQMNIAKEGLLCEGRCFFTIWFSLPK